MQYLPGVLSFEEARARVLGLAPRLGTTRAPLEEATGRVLASAVTAPHDMPPWDYSAMDGYAVATEGWANAAARTLPVTAESRAGSAPFPLAEGTACRIFTGAPVPLGANAVVMQEHVDRQGTMALFREPPAPRANIRRRGEDLRAGDSAIAAGTRLRPAHVALAASCDLAWLEVTRRPLVAIVGTGDELRPPGSADKPGSIPESNGPAIRAMAIRAGAEARVLPSAGDDRAVLRAAFETALAGADLLVTIGGVSVGDHDLVRPVLEELGARIDFWKVAMKPGKPLLAGKRGDAVVLGLPGNPSSAMVTFALFGVPLLRAMQGDTRPLPAPMRARLARDFAHAPGRTEFIRATTAWDAEELVATPLPNQASGASASVAGADALVRIDAERGAVRAGDRVEVFALDELCG
jgi:molybdopterin molybdotransferase